jgi:hypothetical protein
MRSSDSSLASCCSGVVPSWLAWSSKTPGLKKAAASDPDSASSWGSWLQEALDPYCLPCLLTFDPLCPVHPCLSPTRFLPFPP